jgi:hypothetical protein
MPASAYALVALFLAISIAVACLAAWVVGPRRPRAVVVPGLAAFGALYLVGHRLVLQIGPEVQLFGGQVSLPFDVAIALAAALAAAAGQRLGLRLFQPQQGDTGRDSLA